MYKLILALAIMVTAGAVQLPIVFAAAPPQGEIHMLLHDYNRTTAFKWVNTLILDET